MEMTKEIMFEQFGKLKTKDEKVKHLIDLKEMKQKTPHVFRNIKINLKQFDNLIKEWLSVAPFSAMKREIAEREDRELKLELQRRKD